MLSTILELLGMAIMCAAAWLVDFRLGLAVVGLAVLIIGIALGRRRL